MYGQKTPMEIDTEDPDPKMLTEDDEKERILFR